MNCEQIKGRVHSTYSFGTVDGPGVRFVVFLQGCPLRCLYCHNPDSLCPTGGTVMTAGQVMDEVLPYIPFLKNGGITLTGGEPLMQHEFAAAILALAKEHGLHTAVDTSGAIPPQVCEQALLNTDLVLLDIKAANDEAAKRLTGAGLKNAYAMLDYCEQNGKQVWVRHVLLPGYTLFDDDLEQMAVQLKKYSCIKKVELLPFHKMGEAKWQELGMPYALTDTPPPTPQEVENAKNIFKKYGFAVQ